MSTVICAMIFLQPLVDRLLGLPVTEAPRAPAILDRDLAANDQRQDYLRCRLETDENGALRAHPFSRQDSAILSLMAAADGLLVRPPFDPARRAGEKVEILRSRRPRGVFRRDDNLKTGDYRRIYAHAVPSLTHQKN